MNKNRKILALIVARKNSKGLKDKNIYKIKSKPCVYWTFKAAKKSKHINLSMLSTDSYKIISMAKKMKIFCPFVRPSRLSSDNFSNCTSSIPSKFLICDNNSCDFIPI